MKQEGTDMRAEHAQCKGEMAASELDPIRSKVELFKNSQDIPAPFEIASNDTVPTGADRAVIARWATLRDACIKRFYALLVAPPSASPLQRSYLQQDYSFVKEANAHVSDLVVALHQQKLTYGEFAQKRYEIFHKALTSEAAFRQAALEKDEQRQSQARQQFANSLSAWALYMQAVNARQPQTVNIQGTILIR